MGNVILVPESLDQSEEGRKGSQSLVEQAMTINLAGG